jgi:hypothetical protein
MFYPVLIYTEGSGIQITHVTIISEMSHGNILILGVCILLRV